MSESLHEPTGLLSTLASGTDPENLEPELSIVLMDPGVDAGDVYWCGSCSSCSWGSADSSMTSSMYTSSSSSSCSSSCGSCYNSCSSSSSWSSSSCFEV